MTKNDWLQICRLNHEWYLRGIINDVDDEWIKSHMPSDKTFDDGRIEFFQEKFKPETENTETEDESSFAVYKFKEKFPKKLLTEEEFYHMQSLSKIEGVRYVKSILSQKDLDIDEKDLFLTCVNFYDIYEFENYDIGLW